MPFPLKLSKTYRKAVFKICEFVAEKCANNRKSVEMAEGIANFVRESGVITEKQAAWICQNADYWHLDGPPELQDSFIAKRNGKGATPNQGGSSNSLKDEIRDINRKVDRLLKIISGDR